MSHYLKNKLMTDSRQYVIDPTEIHGLAETFYRTIFAKEMCEGGEPFLHHSFTEPQSKCTAISEPAFLRG